MNKLNKVSQYRRRFFYNFFSLFVIFAIVIGGFQYKREKNYRVSRLENTLQIYVNLVDELIQNSGNTDGNSYNKLKDIHTIFPEKELRITVIDKKGIVLFDSFVDDYSSMENHLQRSEIQESMSSDAGRCIRQSNTTSIEYYYYAVSLDNYFIRAALPYNIRVENFLKADTWFIYIILLLFVVFSVFIIYLSDRLGKSISTLHSFAQQAAKGTLTDIKTEFPKNELGFIGEQIVEVYNSLQKTKKALSAEREKLFRHLQISNEGIAVFTKNKKQLLANNHFIQYLNIISDEPAASHNCFLIDDLKPINDFIDENIKKRKSGTNEFSHSVLKINKSGKFYEIQAIVFKDRSFEISISDVTRFEKDKKLKQQMTSNISHELKTPVSSILGYLETILSSEMDEEKKRFFLERSHFQTERLSALIQDISLLNKIEEASDLFGTEKLNVSETVNLVVDDLRMELDEKSITVNIELSDVLEINGNRSIFYSIWRNLTENSVNYAGESISINIKNYHEDGKYLYFSYSDTGAGIPDNHLARIFERFYRVDSDRARSNGGTGLGLAIVKNGVLFHKGEISVKKAVDGGVEFLFSILK